MADWELEAAAEAEGVAAAGGAVGGVVGGGEVELVAHVADHGADFEAVVEAVAGAEVSDGEGGPLEFGGTRVVLLAEGGDPAEDVAAFEGAADVEEGVRGGDVVDLGAAVGFAFGDR